MRLPDEPEVEGEINVVPMIDVIFALLTFFIFSSLDLTRSEGLPVNLPSAKTAEVKQVSQINVTVQPNGNLFVDRQPIKLASLQDSVGKLIGTNKEGLVIINADEKVSHGVVVEVMDELRQVKGAKLAIATKKQ